MIASDVMEAIEEYIEACIEYERSYRKGGEWGPGEMTTRRKEFAADEFTKILDKYIDQKIEGSLVFYGIAEDD